MLNLSQLEAFVETARQGSYTRAAERLFISQPALHHKVKQLEAELGVSLLVVRNRRVIATAEGHLAFEVAERVLNELNELEAQLRRASEQATVRVGAVSLLGAMALSEAVEAFRHESPHVKVQVISLDPDEVYDSLVSNRVDLAVAYREYVTTDLETEPFIESEVIAAAAPHHPLVDGVAHDPVELLAFPIALTQKGMGLRTKVEAWFAEVAGIQDLPVVFEARTGALIAQAAASAHGYITFLPRPSLSQFNLGEVMLRGPRIPSVSVICYLPAQHHRRTVAAFLNTMRAVASGYQPEPHTAGATPAHSGR